MIDAEKEYNERFDKFCLSHVFDISSSVDRVKYNTTQRILLGFTTCHLLLVSSFRFTLFYSTNFKKRDLICNIRGANTHTRGV